MSGDAEQQGFEQEVKEVQQWWTDSRWRYTRRPYTAEQIVSKRGTIKIEYPSNHQAKKLWKLVEGRFQVRQLQSSSEMYLANQNTGENSFSNVWLSRPSHGDTDG